jgi:hypothetical protein
MEPWNHGTRGALKTIFLLSPAFCGGRRAAILLNPRSPAVTSQALRAGTLSLGGAFTFMSGLYFRGKLAYAERFGRALVITPTRGLQPPTLPFNLALLREFAVGDVSLESPIYRTALERDIEAIARKLTRGSQVVLLGSVASGKYVDVLLPILGDRLRYPTAFVGRGDMSRGGLMLRSAANGDELEYGPLTAGVRPRGPPPMRLSISGCARGRVFTVDRNPEHELGGLPTIEYGSKIRLQGQKKLLDEIKVNEKSMVEITGLMKQSDVVQPGVGLAGGRVRIAPAMPMGRGPAYDPGPQPPILDIESWRLLNASCPSR